MRRKGKPGIPVGRPARGGRTYESILVEPELARGLIGLSAESNLSQSAFKTLLNSSLSHALMNAATKDVAASIKTRNGGNSAQVERKLESATSKLGP